jgi:calcium/calmodulin-dependent protein kinase I
MMPQLGEGQFGYVFKRVHVTLGTQVAVKRTKPTVLDKRNGAIVTHADLCEKCMEVRTLLRLRSNTDYQARHVLQLREIFWDGATEDLHIVTELLGLNLREWLSRQDMFTEQQAREVANSILHGLDFMHRNNVVHRDIKEDNVMFRHPNDLTTMKIVDFGFAKELRVGETTREVCGSLGYLAPEIYEGERYRTEADMFSFGVLLFRILSAEKPWPAAPSEATKQATIQLQYRIDKRQWLIVSELGKDMVRRLLTYAPDRLSASDALRHSWLGDRTQSILQTDPGVFFPGARARHGSRAVIEVRGTISFG